MLACSVAYINIMVSDQVRYNPPRRYQSNAIKHRVSDCALAKPQLGGFLTRYGTKYMYVIEKKKTDPLMSTDDAQLHYFSS